MMTVKSVLLAVVFCITMFAGEARGQSAAESLERAFQILTNAPNPNTAWEQAELGPVLKSVVDRRANSSEYRTALLMYARWVSESYSETAGKESQQLYKSLAVEPNYSWQREVAKCAIAGVQFDIDWPTKWKAASDALATVQWEVLEQEKDPWFHRFSNLYPAKTPLTVEMKDGLYVDLAEVYIHSNRLAEADEQLTKVQDKELRDLIVGGVDYQNLLKQGPPASASSQAAPSSPKTVPWSVVIGGTLLLLLVVGVGLFVMRRKSP